MVKNQLSFQTREPAGNENAESVATTRGVVSVAKYKRLPADAASNTPTARTVPQFAVAGAQVISDALALEPPDAEGKAARLFGTDLRE
jgi:hypothetical protein